MTPEVQAFASGFLTTLLHAVVSLAILFAAVAVYAILSPHKEVQQVRDGNGAASIALAGVILSIAAPLAVSLSASPSLLEIVLWGVATSAVQLLLFRVVDFLLKGLPERVDEGDLTAAGLLTAAKLASALVLAAAVAG